MSESTKSSDPRESSPDWLVDNQGEPLYPAVRYADPEKKREPKLRRLSEPIPSDAITVGPIYLLTQGQLDRQTTLQNPHAIRGESCIAKELQEECEQEDRVVYPVYAESDEYEENGKPLPTIIKEITEFVESWLEIPTADTHLYFTGNRSIHAHLPVFVTTENDRKRLKELAIQFNEETGTQLDTGIYSPKQQFRLPGVEHEDTGMVKVEIQPDWSHTEIIRASSTSTDSAPNTYLEFLAQHPATRYIAEPTAQLSDDPNKHGRDYLSRILSADAAILQLGPESDIETPLVEREAKPDDPAEHARWKRYNRHPFSPYANADTDGTRSIAIVRVQGGAFSRRNDRRRTYLPCYIYGAVGGDGEYTIHEEYGRVLLSPQDFEKCGFLPGETLAILGGRSRNSRILEIDQTDALRIAETLQEQEDGRSEAIAVLEQHGYDVGEAGPSVPEPQRRTQTREPQDPPIESPAHRLQMRAETEGIHTLSHEEKWRVANRLLQKHGWDRTWDWFREQFGDDFDSNITYTQLKSLVNAHSDLSHISVPSRECLRE